LGNKTDVGLSDNVVQLIKAHSLHTLFPVFEKKRNFQIFQVSKSCQLRTTLWRHAHVDVHIFKTIFDEDFVDKIKN